MGEKRECLWEIGNYVKKQNCLRDFKRRTENQFCFYTPWEFPSLYTVRSSMCVCVTTLPNNVSSINVAVNVTNQKYWQTKVKQQQQQLHREIAPNTAEQSKHLFRPLYNFLFLFLFSSILHTIHIDFPFTLQLSRLFLILPFVLLFLCGGSNCYCSSNPNPTIQTFCRERERESERRTRIEYKQNNNNSDMPPICCCWCGWLTEVNVGVHFDLTCLLCECE